LQIPKTGDVALVVQVPPRISGAVHWPALQIRVSSHCAMLLHVAPTPLRTSQVPEVGGLVVGLEPMQSVPEPQLLPV
jgi:hypothetical protein